MTKFDQFKKQTHKAPFTVFFFFSLIITLFCCVCHSKDISIYEKYEHKLITLILIVCYSVIVSVNILIFLAATTYLSLLLVSLLTQAKVLGKVINNQALTGNQA